MWIFIIQLVFLYLYITRTTGYSNVLLNRVSFGCIDDCETLQLICSVKDLGLGAFIFHGNEEQAQCVAFIHISCFSVKGNITIISSRDISFTIGTRNRGFLNGTWTCRNGAGERDENSSIEVISTKCESFSIYSKGSKEKDYTKVGLMLIASPLVVFSATVLSLRCCIIKGQNIKNRSKPLKWLINKTEWLLQKIVCLWKCCIIKEGNATRTGTGTEIGCQCFYCFILFGVYCIAASAVFLMALGTDLENAFLIGCCLLGIIVACLIPIIWSARIVSTDTTRQPQESGIVADDNTTTEHEADTIPLVCTHSSTVSSATTTQSQIRYVVDGDKITIEPDPVTQQVIRTHSKTVPVAQVVQKQHADADNEIKIGAARISPTVWTSSKIDEHESSGDDGNSQDEFESVTDEMQQLESNA